MRKVGGLIQRHLENILTFCRHRITNDVAEGAEQQDHGHQTEGLRLQEPGPLQDRHLLLLRRPEPLPSQLIGALILKDISFTLYELAARSEAVKGLPITVTKSDENEPDS